MMQEKTFQYQKTLPRLPIPPIEETIRKYLESLKPFGEEVHKRAEKSARQFLEDGTAQKLQKMLKQRDAREPYSWLQKLGTRFTFRIKEMTF